MQANIIWVILCLILAFWVGLNLGRLLTLWQIETSDSHKKGEEGNDKVQDVK